MEQQNGIVCHDENCECVDKLNDPKMPIFNGQGIVTL